MPINVQQMDCDFFTFSGHKIFGPTGIGVLYGMADLLVAMPPWQGGGNMIKDVTFEKTTYQRTPQKFEAGTPAIAEVVGLGAAIDYVSQIGMAAIALFGIIGEVMAAVPYYRARNAIGIFTCVGAAAILLGLRQHVVLAKALNGSEIAADELGKPVVIEE